MPADPRLLAHPAVIATAEERARVRIEAAFCIAKRFDISGTDMVAVEASLLADASRPAARDWMARRIAEAIGWDHWRVSRAAEGSEPEKWRALMDACNVPERERRLASAAALTLVFLAVVR